MQTFHSRYLRNLRHGAVWEEWNGWSNVKCKERDLLGEDGGDSLARTAPSSEAVKHDNLVVLNGLLEFVGATLGNFS